MQEHTVNQSLNRGLNQRQPWMVCLCLLGFALLLSLALGASAVLNYLVPKAPNRAPGVAARLGWYLHSGQLKADVRTLAATVQFIQQDMVDTPAITNLSDLPVAEKAAPSSPNS